MTARSHSRSRDKQKRAAARSRIEAEANRLTLKPRKIRRQQVGYVIVREADGPVRYNEDSYYAAMTSKSVKP